MKMQKGMVLISVLLIFTVLSLLLMNLLEAGLLEEKMSSNFQQNITNFHETEQTLLDDENSILQNSIPKDAKVIVPAANSKICGVTYYRVNVAHSHGNATTQLESTFAKIGDTSKCNPKPIVHEGRQSFRDV